MGITHRRQTALAAAALSRQAALALWAVYTYTMTWFLAKVVIWGSVLKVVTVPTTLGFNPGKLNSRVSGEAETSQTVNDPTGWGPVQELGR